MANTITTDGPSPMTVVFSEATDEQHRLQCYKLAVAAFGAPLSEQDYVEREEYLDQQPLTRHGGWRTWCLRTTTTTEPPGQAVVSTCKTIQRSLIVRDAGAVSREKGYCIASMVTHPDFRGRGLASALLEHLGRWLDGPGEALASMLYTSIGNENKDERHISVLPTPDITAWKQDRGDFTAAKTFDRIPQHHGSICESADTWLYWYHDYRKKHLAVQRVYLGPQDDHPQLIQALAAILLDAVKDASNWNQREVVVWDPSAATLEAASILGKTHGFWVDHGERDGASMSSIRWHGADFSREIIVHNNEKFTYS
ncbi:hypothetical protein PG994_005602 [Apiospora phragmitis]|uniref:N-acetyltransferase domain-containing protein n=1 Tax=Apiospora phragmitis TaxID=2905665 RepID=A0ABR1VCN9_9PEZI